MVDNLVKDKQIHIVDYPNLPSKITDQSKIFAQDYTLMNKMKKAES